jgi:hypothetical protein
LAKTIICFENWKTILKKTWLQSKITTILKILYVKENKNNLKFIIIQMWGGMLLKLQKSFLVYL